MPQISQSHTITMYRVILTWPLSWMVFIFVLNFGTQGGSITGSDSIPNLGLGKVNSICDGATFIEIWPFSSSLCQTCWRFRQSACVKDEIVMLHGNINIKGSLFLNFTLILLVEIIYMYTKQWCLFTWKRSIALIRWSGSSWFISVDMSSFVWLGTFIEETINIDAAAPTTSLSISLQNRGKNKCFLLFKCHNIY